MILNDHKVVIRDATKHDETQINNLVQFGAHVHQHLDWRQPVDWIGYSPFVVAEWNYKLTAALSCPPDTKDVAWIRLFAVNSLISRSDAWRALWVEARKSLTKIQVEWVAVISFHRWFQKELLKYNFVKTGEVVVLQWDRKSNPESMEQPGVRIRLMTREDLGGVYQVDQLAFTPPWRNSKSLLEIAFSKSSYATVAEVADQIVGYQMSTSNASKGHLARLAVHPEYQGRGIGLNLVKNVLFQYSLWGTLSFTVNTQSDNYVSLSLYKRTGFKSTDKVYPVYLMHLENS
jgi:ribosomal-protein-alanine N-acetyltransferase